MLWNKILNNWKNGTVFKYPKKIKDKFEWNTSVLKNNGNVEYKQNFKINNKLPETQNMTDFQEYINNSKNKYVTTFLNLSKDTILIVPIPVQGKNYATLKDFIDNSSERQQKKFWKKVAEVAEKIMNKYKKVWISTHGLGVAYTHVRISITPKYYFDNELKKE